MYQFVHDLMDDRFAPSSFSDCYWSMNWAEKSIVEDCAELPGSVASFSWYMVRAAHVVSQQDHSKAAYQSGFFLQATATTSRKGSSWALLSSPVSSTMLSPGQRFGWSLGHVTMPGCKEGWNPVLCSCVCFLLWRCSPSHRPYPVGREGGFSARQEISLFMFTTHWNAIGWLFENSSYFVFKRVENSDKVNVSFCRSFYHSIFKHASISL